MKLYTEEQVIEFTMAMISQYEFGNKNIHNRELLKESLDNKKPIELSVVEIKQSITNTKLTISEKHDLAVAIFEKLGGEVKSYIDEETKSEIVNKLTKKWNSVKLT